jgi:hypothetical protein
LLFEIWQAADNDVIFASLFDVFDVFGEIHVFDEVLVDVLELGCFLGQTLPDVLCREDRLERGPE